MERLLEAFLIALVFSTGYLLGSANGIIEGAYAVDEAYQNGMFDGGM